MGESAEMAKKRFRVECSNIAFERKGTSSLSFGGPGHIGQDAHGRLEYVCHIDANAVQNLTRSLTAPAGVAGSVSEGRRITF